MKLLRISIQVKLSSKCLKLGRSLIYLKPRIILNSYYFDRLYQWLVNNIVLAASKSVSQFDRIVINDTGVDQPAAFVMISAVRARYLQTGKVYNYGAVMAVGVSVIIILWWLLV